MANTQKRSLRLGYKYLWDDTQHQKNIWRKFAASDYKFLTPRGRSGIKTGLTQYRGGGVVGDKAPRGGFESTFNLQPRMVNVRAQQEADPNKAKEYRRKRLFSWALYHHPDETAALFPTRLGMGIPTQESTTTDGGGRGGPKEISKEEGMKKFFWGMVRFPDAGGGPNNRQRIETVSGRPKASMQMQDAVDGGSSYRADRIFASENEETLFGKYQRDILPKAIWKIKRLSEEMLQALLLQLPNVAGIEGARRSLGTYSEEELAILIMQGIQFNLNQGMPEAEAVEAATRDSPERRYEDPSTPHPAYGRQLVDIDPKFQPEASAFLVNYFRSQASDVSGGGNFVGMLDEYSTGGIEVSMVNRRLESAYRLSRDNYTTAMDTVNAISSRMVDDIRHHLLFQDEGQSGHGMGYGAARRYRAAGTNDFNYIYTSNIGNDGIAIYMVNITGNQPTVVPFVLQGPNSDGTLHQKMIKDLFSNYNVRVIEETITNAQVGGLVHDTAGNIYVGAGVTELMPVDFLGDGFRSGRGFGGKMPSSLYVRTQANVVAPAVVANEVFDWVEAGANQFLDKVTVGTDTTELRDFIYTAQIRAESEVGVAEHEVERGWQSWLESLGGKFSPKPMESYDWARFLHPRPFITEDRKGV